MPENKSQITANLCYARWLRYVLFHSSLFCFISEACRSSSRSFCSPLLGPSLQSENRRAEEVKRLSVSRPNPVASPGSRPTSPTVCSLDPLGLSFPLVPILSWASPPSALDRLSSQISPVPRTPTITASVVTCKCVSPTRITATSE